LLPRRVASRVNLVVSHEYTGLPDAVSLLIDAGGCRVLVDSGSGLPASNAALLASLAALGVRVGGLDVLVNTHCHLPNAGGDWFVHDRLRTVVAAWESDAKAIETGDPTLTAADEYGIPFTPTPVGLPLSREGPLPGCGEVRVLHTPGHTPGSITLVYEDPADGLVAAVGDALGSLKSSWGSSERDWWRSLEKIKGLDARVLCTSSACLKGGEVREFLEAVEAEGPKWLG